jgi:hypothetical protein
MAPARFCVDPDIGKQPADAGPQPNSSRLAGKDQNFFRFPGSGMSVTSEAEDR